MRIWWILTHTKSSFDNINIFMPINILQKYGLFLHVLRYFSFSVYLFIFEICGYAGSLLLCVGFLWWWEGSRQAGFRSWSSWAQWFWHIMGLDILCIPYPFPVFYF